MTPRCEPLAIEPEVATSETIAAALSRSFFGREGDVAIVERRAIPYRSTFPLEELLIETASGFRERLVFKDLAPPGSEDGSGGIKAPFLHQPQREIVTYRSVLAPSGLSVPRYRGAVSDPVEGRHWLFIELIDGEPLWQRGDRESWIRAAEWIADLHARFAGQARDLPDCLLRCDRSYYERWLERAAKFVRWPVDSSRGRRDIAWLAQRVGTALDWLAAQPLTLLHGEYCPANVLVERRAGHARIRPVDWEMAAVGAGLLDLAALTSGDWTTQERGAMAAAYREALPAHLRLDLEELLAGLDRCRLLWAVQWLGWSNDWTPPPEQAHDWLETALALAEEIAP